MIYVTKAGAWNNLGKLCAKAVGVIPTGDLLVAPPVSDRCPGPAQRGTAPREHGSDLPIPPPLEHEEHWFAWHKRKVHGRIMADRECSFPFPNVLQALNATPSSEACLPNSLAEIFEACDRGKQVTGRKHHILVGTMSR